MAIGDQLGDVVTVAGPRVMPSIACPVATQALAVAGTRPITGRPSGVIGRGPASDSRIVAASEPDRQRRAASWIAVSRRDRTFSRGPSSALNKHKSLRQLFKWLRDDEEDIDHSPMERVRQPAVPLGLM